MRSWLLVLIVLVPAGRALGEPRSLTLSEAIALAVRQNPALAAAGADVSIADAGIESARGLDDFIVDASAVWRETRREPVAGTPVQQPAFDEATGALALTKPLPTGGRVGLHLVGDYSLTRFATDLGTMMAASRSISEAYAPSLQLTISHPLLRGFGVGVARADRRRARAQRDVAGAQREGLAAALVRDVVAAYWDLAYATSELAIRRAAAASAREQLRRVEANIAVGKQPRSASAEIEVAIALRDDAVLMSEQALTDRALELQRLCGVPPQPTGAQVAARDVPEPSLRIVDGPATLTAALAHNPQLQAIRAQGQAAAIEIDVTDNGLLPQLDLAFAGGPIGNARDAGGAYDQLTGLHSYAVFASLVFQQPIGRHAARGALEAAREVMRKARLSEADVTTQVSAAVAHSVAAVETARRRQEVLLRSTDAAALDLEAEKARFEVGRSTNFDVLRRQDSLASVQLVLMRARVDHLKALATVDALTTEIFARNGVALR